MMRRDARPVIYGLQRQVNVLVHLELDYRQPPVPIDGQQIDDAPVAAMTEARAG